MDNDPLLRDALQTFVFSHDDINRRNGNNSVPPNEERKHLEDLTRQLIRAVSTSDSQEYLSLSPSTSLMAIHAVGKAASFCRNLNTDDDSPTSLPFAAVEFLTTAFGYLEPDLVYTTLRLPILEDPLKRHLNESNHQKMTKKNAVTVIDVLAWICIYGTRNDVDKTNDLGSRFDVSGLWYESKFRVFAFMSLCRGIQAAEIVQKLASSKDPYPSVPQDSALGSGMGLGLDMNHSVNERISHLAVDYILHIDAGGNKNPTQKDPSTCPICSNPIENLKDYQICDCESRRNRGYLYVACVVFLSMMLRSNLHTWLTFKKPSFSYSSSSIHDANSQPGYTELKTLRLCEALARCVASLEDRSIKVQGKIAAFVSVSLVYLVVKNSYCPLEDFVIDSVFLKSVSKHVIRAALLSPLIPQSEIYDHDTKTTNPRAQLIMRKRAITALVDTYSKYDTIEKTDSDKSAMQDTLEENYLRLLRLADLGTQEFNECVTEPGLEGHLMCMLTLNTLCTNIARPVMKRILSNPTSQRSKQNDTFQETDPLFLILKSLMRLSMSERFTISACASSILISVINDRRSNKRSDLVTRKIWEEIEHPDFGQQEISPLLIHILIFMKKNCDLRSLELKDEFDQEELIGFSINPFKVQIYRCEPRLCSLLDLFLFFCSGDVLRHIKFEKEFCNSTVSVFGYISSSYIGYDRHNIRAKYDQRNSTHNNLSVAVSSNIEIILTRLGYFDTLTADTGNMNDKKAMQHKSECRDTMTSNSLIKALSLISKQNISDEKIASKHAALGTTVASCFIQGCSRDLVRRGMILYTVFQQRISESDIISHCIFEKCAMDQQRLTQMAVNDKKYEEEYIFLKKALLSSKKDKDQCYASLQMKSTEFEKDLTFAKLQASAEAMDLIDSHVYERETAEKHARQCQSEMENMKKRMMSMEKKLIETETNMEKERERTDREILEANNQIKELQISLKEERGMRISKEQALGDTLHRLDETKNELTLVTEENNTNARKYEALVNLQKESQVKIESTCFKLVCLAEKYKDKENLISNLNRRLHEVGTSAQAETKKLYNRSTSLEVKWRGLLEENKMLRQKLGSNPQNRNQSAIAVALQEMEAEVPKPQKRDDTVRPRGRSVVRKR